MDGGIKVLPIPARLTTNERSCTLGPSLDIVAVQAARGAAQYLGRMLEGAGVAVRFIFIEPNREVIGSSSDDSTEKIGRILFALAPDRAGGGISLGNEGYRLRITNHEIRIEASEGAGFAWAVQTVRQLLPTEVDIGRSRTILELPQLEIEDAPRFSWRGLHFDVARHFFPVESIKRLIDLLALYKLNRFHWHLTDDQGWRIEIRRYPELAKVGGWRRGEDGSRYGGYYTQEEIREVVAFASERHVVVVPEIEMPGHARAAVAAYPWLTCAGEVVDVWSRGGISKELFCAGREETFELLEGVLDEVADLFPGDLVHIGGDECPKDRWKVCPDCQARIREEGLADEEELQAYFVRRIQGHLSRLGKRIVGWDEILEGGLAPGATVMSWRGVEGGVAAARQGHDVVMTPTSHCYFDYRQSNNRGEPGPTHFDPPVTTLRRVYSFEPVPDGLTAEEGSNVLGSQGNLWTEDVDDFGRATYMIFPRLCALAEVLWSPRELRNWEGFKQRLTGAMKRLDAFSVEYCRVLESLE